MTLLLELELGTESIDRARVDLVVAGFFADELPLHGPVGRADWRLCGLISRQLDAERLRGDPGEAVLLATFGRLGAPHVLALGLGERAHFGRDDVRSHVQDAVGRAVRLGLRSVALAPLGLLARPGMTGADPASLDVAELADEVVTATLEALRRAAQSGSPQPQARPAGAGMPIRFRMRLLIEVEEESRVRRALAEAVAGSPEVVFDRDLGRPRERQPPSGISATSVRPIGP